VLGDGDGLWLGDGEPEEGVGEGLGEAGLVWLLLGLGEAGLDGCRVAGAVCCLGADCPPTMPPTVVPDPLRCQTTASSGFPATSSNPLIPPITPRNIPRLATVTSSQPGRLCSQAVARCGQAAPRCGQAAPRRSEPGRPDGAAAGL
jgi:hypothetical protein